MASLILISTNSFSAQMTNIKNLTNTKLQAASSELAGMDIVTHYATKKVQALSNSARPLQMQREKAVAQAIHTLCPHFDDGVNIGLTTKDEKGTLAAVSDFGTDLTKGDAAYNQLVRNLSKINNQKNVELYSGNVSGNNTMGSVVGFFDIDNNEIGVFASTNCGRED